MANTTYNLSKAVSLTQYQKPFINGTELVTFDWKQFTTVKRTTNMTEQTYGYWGLGSPAQVNEQQPYVYYDMGELDATTWTMVKWGYGTRFSYEIIKYNRHLPDLLKESATRMGKGHSYLRDSRVARWFNRVATDTAYDSVAFAGTHTLADGTSFDNNLTAASMSFDSLWTMLDFHLYQAYNQSGQLFVSKPKWLVMHPALMKTFEKIYRSPYESDQADWNANTIKALWNITPVYNPLASSTTAYTLLTEDFKDDFLFWEVEAPQTFEDTDFDVDSVKIKSRQIFTLGARDFVHLVYNPGA